MRNFRIWSFIAILAVMFLGYSCDKDEEITPTPEPTPIKPEKPKTTLVDVTVNLVYTEGFKAKEDVTIKARSGSGVEFKGKTNNAGSVKFKLPLGAYEFTATDMRTKDKKYVAFNGLLSKTIKEAATLSLEMQGSPRSQLILKEVYFGGCPKDDNPKRSYSFDSYIKLYNNSPEPVDLQNLCVGSLQSNSYFMKYDIKEGETEPFWFKTDWTPTSVGYFYFPNATVLEPFKSMTVAVNGAIDHSQVHSQSVNLSSAENYVMYDIEKFDNKYYYPAPSASIPANHYLKAAKFPNVPNNAWSAPVSCPDLFLFYPEKTPDDYANDNMNFNYWKDNKMFPRKEVPAKFTVDGIDAFAAGKDDKNIKRLNPKIDAGYIYFVSGKGYTLYRNVDKELTEAIKGNKEKLVYSYAMGTKDVEPKYGSTDPSGIDAEASIANGAVIIYKDTNNSGNDFHMRKKSTLRK